MSPKEIEYIDVSDKKCYICGRSEEDLNALNEKIFLKYKGDLKDYYYKQFGLKLEEKGVITPILSHNESNNFVDRAKEEDGNLRKNLFHPNEVTDQWIQLGLKFDILKIIFKKNKDELIPEITLTGKKPSDKQMKEFRKVDKYHWLSFSSMDNARKRLLSDFNQYCKKSKKISRFGSFRYLRDGINKQFAVHVKVHICTICSLVRLPGIQHDDDDFDDDSEKSYDVGFEYSAVDQDNWGDL